MELDGYCPDCGFDGVELLDADKVRPSVFNPEIRMYYVWGRCLKCGEEFEIGHKFEVKQ